MPLSETNKQQSQSIEDLIAQLDAPQGGAATANGANGDHGSNHFENVSQNAGAGANNNSRKLLKGKRMNSNGGGSSPSSNSNLSNTTTPTNPTSNPNHRGATSASSFVKTPSFGQNSEPLLSKNIIMSKKYSKHLVTARNKGTHKMVSGKHSWGAPGCELVEDVLDSKDPNYDSEDGGNVVMVCVENSDGGGGNKSDNAKRGVRAAAEDDDDDDDESPNENLKELDVDDLEREIKLVILEYFQNGDTIEVIDHLKCYKFNRIKSLLISYLIQIALEHNNTCKELTSRLLRDLKIELFAEKDFVSGFDNLLKNINDLTLDNPDAPESIGRFIARSIADKVVTKAYLDRFFSSEESYDKSLPDLANDKVQKAVESARLLVNMNDHLFQLSHTWGNKGGFLAVKELSDKISELIQEYHDSGDVEEAIRCLKELNVPHFHHEFVYETLDFSLQKASDHSIELFTTLLKRLCETVVITYDQLKMGFNRLFAVLPDISLDVPNANAILDKILNKGHAKGFVSEDIMEMAPNRSRKRFVSEGDGGRIKEENGH